MKKTVFFAIFSVSIIYSQVGIGTDTPNTSSALEVKSDNKGVLIPRVQLKDINDTTTIPNPVNGLIVFNLEDAGIPPNNVLKNTIYAWKENIWGNSRDGGTGSSDGNGIYSGSGTITKNTLVQQGDNHLAFTSNTGNVHFMGGIKVGIGTASPDNSAAIHITNEGVPNKGAIIAPMTTSQRDAIVSPADGLFIYNITQKCFNYYNSTKWESLCGAIQPAQVSPILSGSLECSNISIKGTYEQRKPTDASNYIDLPITVNSEGSISIVATTSNGYSFTYTSSLIQVGNHTLKLIANGTPTNVKTDDVTISINGIDQACKKTINVSPNTDAPLFTVATAGVTVFGEYLITKALDGTNYITVQVTNNNSSNATPYSIFTNTIDGISFSGSGSIPPGATQSISLLGNGTPTATGVKNFTISSNSTQETTSIPVNVTVSRIAKLMKVLNYGGGYSFANGNFSAIMDNKNNFGTNTNSIVKIEGFTRINGNSPNDVTNLDPDLVVIGWDYSNVSNLTTIYNACRTNNIPLILNIENQELQVLNMIYPANTFTNGGDAGFTEPMSINVPGISPTDPIIYGPFSPSGITNYQKDGGGDTWMAYASLPPTITKYVERTSTPAIAVFRDESKALLYHADGGNINQSQQSNGVPTNNTAKYWANALAWAIKYDLDNGRLGGDDPKITGFTNCDSPVLSEPIVAEFLIKTNPTVKVHYTGGNGKSYPSGSSITSSGVTGLFAQLKSGVLLTGEGDLTFDITGTPSATGTATFNFSFGGQTCSLKVNIVTSAVMLTGFTATGYEKTYYEREPNGIDLLAGAPSVCPFNFTYDYAPVIVRTTDGSLTTEAKIKAGDYNLYLDGVKIATKNLVHYASITGGNTAETRNKGIGISFSDVTTNSCTTNVPKVIYGKNIEGIHKYEITFNNTVSGKEDIIFRGKIDNPTGNSAGIVIP